MLCSGKYYFVYGNGNDVEIGSYDLERNEFMSLFNDLDSLSMMTINSNAVIKDCNGTTFSIALFYALMKNTKFYKEHCVGFNYKVDTDNHCIIIPSVGLTIKLEDFVYNKTNDDGGYYSFELDRYILSFDDDLTPYYDETEELLNDVLSEIICQHIMSENLTVVPDTTKSERFVTLDVEHAVVLGYKFTF